MLDSECIFCDRDNSELNTILEETELAYARWDNYPVNEGHAQALPKRHVESFFELTDDEVLELYHLIKRVKTTIDDKHSPNAYNIGVNDGVEAGRTVHHLHIHIIPRSKGDVINPRGGVRNVIPGQGDY